MYFNIDFELVHVINISIYVFNIYILYYFKSYWYVFIYIFKYMNEFFQLPYEQNFITNWNILVQIWWP